MRSRNSVALALGLALAACAGHPERPRLASVPARPRTPVADLPVKVGPPYQVAGRWYVPADTRDYDEVGLASWYGPGFHGGSTADGETYEQDGVSGAHKTLPLPSYVEVTALQTGRTILVRVNDRGPFVADRIIDLSRGAARQLGIERLGVARVRVRRVDPPEADRLALRRGLPAPLRPDASPTMLANLNARFGAALASAAPSRPPVATAAMRTLPATGRRLPDVEAVLAGLDPAPAPLFVEVPASGPVEADALTDRLRGFGPVPPDGITASAVRIGPFADEASAAAVLAQLKSRGYAQARLVHAPASSIQTAGNRTSVTP